MIGRAGMRVAVAVAATAAAAGPAFVAPTPAVAQTRVAAKVVVTQITPQVPGPGDTLQIGGYVQNGGEDDIGPLTVHLEVSTDPIAYRGSFDAYAAGTSDVFTVEVTGADARLGTIAPTELAPFRVRAPLSSLHLAGRGPYAIKVVADGTGVDAQTRTFLPWYPDPAQVKPTKVVLLWPLVDRPAVGQDGVFTSERLAGLFSSKGRLGALVQAAAGKPVSWVVDPDLVVSAQAMSDGYPVRSGGRVGDGGGANAAKSWLDTLEGGTEGGQVLRLPYADADLAALARGKRADDISAAAATADRTLQGVLPGSTAVLWPGSGFADRATLRAARAAGYDMAILSEDALPPTVIPNFTPTGVGRIATPAGSMRGLLADSQLSRMLSQDTRAAGAGALLVQRFLAETAMITEERPNRSRTILVAPPKRWNPDPEFARQLIAAYTTAPWIAPTTATDLTGTDPDVARGPLVYPKAAQRLELPQKHIRAVAALRTKVANFSAILANAADMVSTYRNALLRAESAAWVDRKGRVTKAGQAYLDTLQDGFDQQQKKVRILSRGTVTLSSNSGTIPVTVANDLDQPVTVRLALRPTSSRLKIDDPQPFRLDPKSRVTVEVRASAIANGIVTVDAGLTNPNGDRIGATSQFNVRATNFGRVGFIIIGGAIALLVVSIAIRLVRRWRRPGPGPGSPANGPAERPQPDPAKVGT